MNYLLTLRFVGTNYHGFQIQQNAVTVQSVFQQALRTVLGRLPDIKGCSRTDSGVHAKKYCLSFRAEPPLDERRTLLGLNANLPDDIRVTELTPVSDDFHARYSCTGKRYEYLVCNSRVLDPFLYGRALRFTPRIDCASLNGVAQVFVGKHDFSAFCGAAGKKTDRVRNIYNFTVERRGELVVFSVTADGFLYNMVRIMTGALLNCARGKMDAQTLGDILASGRRSNLCPTAPAEGLYLADVYYGGL